MNNETSDFPYTPSIKARSQQGRVRKPLTGEERKQCMERLYMITKKHGADANKRSDFSQKKDFSIAMLTSKARNLKRKEWSATQNLPSRSSLKELFSKIMSCGSINSVICSSKVKDVLCSSDGRQSVCSSGGKNRFKSRPLMQDLEERSTVEEHHESIPKKKIEQDGKLMIPHIDSYDSVDDMLSNDSYNSLIKPSTKENTILKINANESEKKSLKSGVPKSDTNSSSSSVISSSSSALPTINGLSVSNPTSNEYPYIFQN